MRSSEGTLRRLERAAKVVVKQVGGLLAAVALIPAAVHDDGCRVQRVLTLPARKPQGHGSN